MVKIRSILTVCAALLAFACSCGREGRQADPVYCNPLDLDYGWGVFKQELPLCRTSADPVIVLFKDKYYLFSTHDVGGYRVSDDLCDWTDYKFNEEVREAALNYGSYVAPAVAADDNYIYFIKLNRDRDSKTVKILRSADPVRKGWEVCGEIRRVSDPTLLIADGHYYIYHGLGTGIRRFSLDPATMSEIPGSEIVVLPKALSVDEVEGFELGRRELFDEIEAVGWKGRFSMLPCQEGAWAVRREGRTYLQYATPGTICIWYCDALLTAEEGSDEYTPAPYNPVSLKAGGFIGGAGHSSVFEDRYGNWWEITTMWIGNSNEFERRLGLFPVSYDEKGRMKVHTLLGDYPMSIPQRKFDPDQESNLLGWMCLSAGAAVTASSETPAHPAAHSSDEDVRTWWSADPVDTAPWISMDLGETMTVHALQLNFSEQNFTPDTFEEDYTAYRVYGSEDGAKWSLLVDKSRNKRTNPHEFVAFKAPVRTRFLKLTCSHSMNGVPFAMRELRVFGKGNGQAPPPVDAPAVERDSLDRRFATVRWHPVEGADGYLVRFGIAPDFMNQCIQVKGGQRDSLLVHILSRGQDYHFEVSAYNKNGISSK